MTQHARIPSIYSILDGKTVTIPATPFTDGEPDPRPETAPPRGIVSRKPRSRADAVIAAIREMHREWRAEA